MPAIVNQGITKVRDLIAAGFTHIGISTASDAFSATQTVIDPTAGTNLFKAATKTNIDFQTVDVTATINGTTEFTGLTIRTTATQSAGTRSDIVTRVVRSVGIGVVAGDSFTIGQRWKVTDTT